MVSETMARFHQEQIHPVTITRFGDASIEVTHEDSGRKTFRCAKCDTRPQLTGPVDDRTFHLDLEDGTSREIHLGSARRQQKEVMDFLATELPRIDSVKIEEPPSFFDHVRGYRD